MSFYIKEQRENEKSAFCNLLPVIRVTVGNDENGSDTTKINLEIQGNGFAE